MKNLVTLAIEIVGISQLTKACGLKSRNAIKTWERSGRIPIDAKTDYPGIIEHETCGQVTRVGIWRNQLDTLKPGVVYRVPIKLLNRDHDQPRKCFNTEKLEELALSMGKDGQETPIKFSYSGGELLIKHGERRYRAARIAKMDTLYGILDDQKDETDHDRILKQITDNMGEPLTAWDWVETFKQLHDDGMPDQMISDELTARGIKGFSRPAINNYRRLFKLPEEIQDMIKSGWLTPSHGKQILGQAKHFNIKHQLYYILSDRQKNGDTPTLYDIDIEIRDIYRKEYPCIDDQMNDVDDFPLYCPFDYETECDGCEFKHTIKLNNGHEDTFCTHTACYQNKCALVDATQEQGQLGASDAQDQDGELSPTETPSIAAPNNEPPQPEQPSPDQACSQEIEKSTLDVVIEQEQQKKTYKRRVLDALKTAPVEDIDLILVYCAFSDEQLDGDPATLKAVASRMQPDSEEMKRVAATCVINYLFDSRVAEIGAHLGVSYKPLEHSEDENIGLKF
ncbi:MAG: ParB/RepB/Spo0J family partition protein [Candidatus Thiodiazotropha sp. (ex Epidulcina cf. delphinae)]|nr:ParB/RepB/Spo0J family partition protein [Candidatus Thiodiazotropha sp. (ex Epidulcina cf. delphinae)]